MKNYHHFAFLVFLLAASYPTQAQVQLIAHPNQDSTKLPGIYSVFYEFGGKAFFSARDNIGSALYCTDGTTAGTTFITREFSPEGFTSCGDWLYVFGSKAQYNLPWWNPFGQYAIWRMKADGSERQKLVDLYKPYSMYAHSFYLWSSENRVFFSWREGLSWIDNLTGAVTHVFQGLDRETEDLVNFGIEQKAMARNGVYFMGEGPSQNNFYYTDLTLDGTVGLARIQTGGSAIPSDQMRVVNNRCYVLHTADTMQLWSSDGTPGGTSPIWQNTQFFTSLNPFTPTFSTFKNKLIMAFPEKVHDTIWYSIYTCSDSTVELLHRHPIVFTNYPFYNNLFFISRPDGLYVFAKNPNDAQQWEVWLNDNTGYRQITSIDLPDGVTSISSIRWQNGQFIILARKILMYDDQHFNLQLATDITGSSFYQTSLGIFFTHTKDQQVLEPWIIKTDPPSCTLLKELISDLKYGSISYLTATGNQLYFSANTKEYGTEVWTTDGGAASTRLTKDINTAGNTQPNDLIPYGNKVIFSVPGNYSFTGLWTSDGTDAGTVKLEDLVIRDNDKWCTKVVWKDKIAFAGKPKSSTDDDWHLYISEGTPGEARTLDDSFTNQHFTNVFSLAVAGDMLYFVDNGLWVTDGTEAGTRSIDSFIGGNDQYDYGIYFGNEMCASGSKLYFTRDRCINIQSKMREVWVTDGTAEGTQCVADLGDDFGKNQLMKFMGILIGNLVFTYSTPGNGFELFLGGNNLANPVQLTGQEDVKPDNDKQFTEGIAGIIYLSCVTIQQVSEIKKPFDWLPIFPRYGQRFG